MRKLIIWTRVFLVAVAGLVTLSSCGGGGGEFILGYYLYRELVGNSNQTRIWSGTVNDTASQPLAGYAVEIIADRPDPASDERRSAETTSDGEYRIIMPWYELAVYRITVKNQSVVVYEDEVGPVFNQDQQHNIQISPVATVTVSGTVTDPNSATLAQIFVAVAKPQIAGSMPDVFATLAEGAVNYQLTNNTGVYYFENIFGEPLLVAAFSPANGFGYCYLEEPSAVNSGGTIVMPGTGKVEVSVRVLNSVGEPLVSAILPVDYRFTLRLTPSYNLSSQIGAAVAQEGLFGHITTEEVIALHPVEQTIAVASTDSAGLADTATEVTPGLYTLALEDTQGGTYVGVLVGLAARLIHDAENGEVIEARIPLI